MATMHTEERIGEAWRLHRTGNNSASITLFREIIAKTPKNIDALYGLGLALRADGHIDEAIKTFKEAASLASQGLNAVDTTSQVEGHHGSNDLNTYEDDRFLMLSKMIQQRLAELGV